jgi:hypothetical protein
MNQVLEKYKLIKTKEMCGCEEIYTLEVCIDPNPEDPRDDKNVGIMICFNKNYTIGDKHSLKLKDFSSLNSIKEFLIETEKAIMVLPIYLLDHSGLTITTNSEKFKSCDSNGWDWGQIGYIYTTQERLKEFHIHDTTDEKIKQILNDEVSHYNKYLKCDYYGYILYKNGESEDSCWGFDDKDDMIEEAKKYVQGEWKQVK